MGQLHQENGRLELVEAGIPSTRGGRPVFFRPAILPEIPDFGGECFVRGDDCAAVAARAEVLRRVEAEAAESAEAARASTAPGCAVRLSAIFHDGNAAPARHVEDRL